MDSMYVIPDHAAQNIKSTVDETSIPVTPMPTVTWPLTIEDLPRHPAIRFKDKSERSVLLLPCTHFCGVLLLARLWYHWSLWQVLRQCGLPCHYVNTYSCHLVCTRLPHSSTVLLTRVPCSVTVEPTSTIWSTLHWRNIHILAKLFRSHRLLLNCFIFFLLTTSFQFFNFSATCCIPFLMKMVLRLQFATQMYSLSLSLICPMNVFQQLKVFKIQALVATRIMRILNFFVPNFESPCHTQPSIIFSEFNFHQQ